MLLSLFCKYTTIFSEYHYPFVFFYDFYRIIPSDMSTMAPTYDNRPHMALGNNYSKSITPVYRYVSSERISVKLPERVAGRTAYCTPANR